jgi:hypothetical protein
VSLAVPFIIFSFGEDKFNMFSRAIYFEQVWIYMKVIKLHRVVFYSSHSFIFSCIICFLLTLIPGVMCSYSLGIHGGLDTGSVQGYQTPWILRTQM